MHSKSRIHYPGAVYHVIVRGHGGQDIFLQDNDGHAFCLLLEEAIKRFGFRLYAFCLMPNHVHLAVQVGDISYSRIMRDICFRYTKHINAMREKTGSVFGDRHKAILIDDTNHLMELVRYIHLNPVRAGMVKKPDAHPWNSHHAYMDQGTMPWVSTDRVLSHFSALIHTARERYKSFISEGIREGHRPEFHRGNRAGRILGDKSFARSALRKAAKAQTRLLSLDETIEHVCRLYNIDKGVLAEHDWHIDRSEVRSIIALIVQDQEHLSVTDLSIRFNRRLVTILALARRLLRRIETNPALAERVEMVQDQLARIQADQALSRASMKRPLSMEEIMEHVAGLYSIDPAVLPEPDQRTKRSEARAIIAQMVWERDHLSQGELSRRMNRHPAHISRMAQRLRKRVQTDSTLAGKVDSVRRQLEQMQKRPIPLPPGLDSTSEEQHPGFTRWDDTTDGTSGIHRSRFLNMGQEGQMTHAGAPAQDAPPPAGWTKKLPPVSMDGIIQEVCKLFSLSPGDLAKRDRQQRPAEARAMVALMVYDQDHLSLDDLGKRMNRSGITMGHVAAGLRQGAEEDTALADQVDMLKQHLKHVQLDQMRPRSSVKTRLSMDWIVEHVCKMYALDPEVLGEPNRMPGLAEARAVMALLIRDQDHLSLTDLGRRLNRDVDVINRAAKQLLRRMETNLSLADRVETVRYYLEQIPAAPAAPFPPVKRLLSIDEMVEQVCEVCGLEPVAVVQRNTMPEAEDAHAILALMVRNWNHLSLTDLGKILNRPPDNLYLLSSLARERAESDTDLAGKISTLKQRLIQMDADQARPPCALHLSPPAEHPEAKPRDVVPDETFEPHRADIRRENTQRPTIGEDTSVGDIPEKTGETGKPPLSIDAIIEEVCRLFSLTPVDLAKPGRKGKLAQARAMAALIVRDQDHLSLTELGTRLNRSDAEMQVAANNLRNRVETDHFLAEKVVEAREKLGEGYSFQLPSSDSAKPLVSIDDIIEQVCLVYNVTLALMASPGDMPRVTEARAITALMVDEQDHLSLTELGKRLNRIPGVLRSSVNRMRECVQTDYSLAENLKTVAQRLGPANALHIRLLSSMELPLSLDQVINEVCRLYSLSPDVLTEPGGMPNAAEARAMIALIVGEQRHLSWVELGRRLNRHDSTMSHVARRLRKRMEKKPSLARKAETVRSQLVRIQAGQAPNVPSITPELSIDDIVAEVCRLYGLPLAVLAEPGVEPEYVEARGVAGLIVQDLDQFSLSQLGIRFNRTISPMEQAVKKLLTRMETNPSLAGKVNTLRERMRQIEAGEAPTPTSTYLPPTEEQTEEKPRDVVSDETTDTHLADIHSKDREGRTIVTDTSLADTSVKDTSVREIPLGAGETRKPLLSIDHIIEEVCRLFRLSPVNLAKPGGKPKYARARAMAALIVRDQDHLSLAELGTRLNRSDAEMTVAVNDLRNLVKTDRFLAEQLVVARQKLGVGYSFQLPSSDSAKQHLSIDDIIEEVCRLYSLGPAVLAEEDRTPDVAEARAMIALMVTEQPHLSSADLARRLNRHVTATAHVARRLLKRVEKNPFLAEKVETVRSQLVRIRTGQAPSVPSITTKLSIDEVVEEVCRLYSLRPVVLAEPGIEPERVEARAVAALIVQGQGHFSVSALGRRLNRTSSTMSGGIRTLLKRMETNPDLAEKVNMTRERLKRV